MSTPESRETIHVAEAVEAFRRRHRVDPDAIRRMQYALYRSHEDLTDALQRLPHGAAQFVHHELNVAPAVMHQRFDSSQDRSSKLILTAADGALFETVLLRAAAGRRTVCLSTQVGCRVGCPFCATGRMGLQRNLTMSEIIEQVLVAARLIRKERHRLRNLVFMGMGEPLDNEAALYASLELLLSNRGFALPPRRILVSTVGVPDAVRRLADRFPGVQIAISLHSARADLRRRLVPWSRDNDMAELRCVMRDVANRPRLHRHQGPLMVEHILIDGLNDSDMDARELIQFLDGIDAHINLIPYNPVDHISQWQPTPREQRDRFARRLRDAGYFTTIRYSMGADIGAACGQLVQPRLASACEEPHE